MAELFEHIPVLGAEILRYLTFPAERSARLLDGTLGGGGHSALLLRRYPKLELLGIDRDDSALKKAAETLAFASGRTRFVRGNFSEMLGIAAEHGWSKIDGILLDIGVSSPQLDRPERGFSWKTEGPLDMRMDRRSERTASRILNAAEECELERIFREYGELSQARKLASAVVRRREKKPFALTSELTALCDDVIGRSSPGRIPAPTLVFQALRIAVNDEIGELERALPAAAKLLKREGRLAVISFHSLEDRIVKTFFRKEAASCECPPGLPVCVCGKIPTMRIVTRKPVTAGKEELEKNRRSASAKLRVAEKII